MSKQVMEQALEALLLRKNTGLSKTYDSMAEDAIAALKEAIKQDGEPDYWLSAMGDLYSSPAIAEQYGAAKPYTPLYLAAPSIRAGWRKAINADTPKYGERVLILTTDADGDPVHDLAHFNGKLGYLGVGGKRIKPVSHWMPLPAAPSE